jgi:C_GCAxxG_C_C family probable redox protein
MSELVTVARFPDRFAAEQAQQYLESQGIDAMVQADDAGGALAGLSLSVRGVRLRVRAEDRDRAREALEPGAVVDATEAAGDGAGPEGVPSPAAAAAAATGYFDAGNNCAESVLRTFAADRGVEVEVAVVPLATGFGGGMGGAGDVCGALAGATLALGLALGRLEGDDREAKERCYAAVRTLRERFAAACGSVDCRDLTGVDLTTDAGREAAREPAIRQEVCRRCVGAAAELVAEILAES